MSLPLLYGPTVTLTNGTAQTYVKDGVTVANGAQFQNSTQADASVRESFKLKTRPGVVSLTSIVKDKRTLTLLIPHVDGNGVTTMGIVRVETEFHPEVTNAVRVAQRDMVLGEIGSGTLDDFFQFGTVDY